MNRQNNNAGRGRNNDEVSSSLATCNTQLEFISERVRNQCEEFPVEELNKLKEKILSLTKEVAAVDNNVNSIKTAIEIAKRKAGEENANETDPEVIVESITTNARNLGSHFDPNSAPLVLKIQSMLKVEDEDEEIQVVGGKIAESNFQCPYTASRLVEPMTK